MEVTNKDSTEKLQAEVQRKEEEIASFQQEFEKKELYLDSLEKQVGQLQNSLQEKEQLILQNSEKDKKLEEQITEVILTVIYTGNGGAKSTLFIF